jgi:hypothetical protein
MHDLIHQMTWQQRQLAEIMWDLTAEQIQSFVRALPTEYHRRDAVLIYEIMILETIDYEIQSDQDVAAAAEILRRIAQSAPWPSR